MKCTYPHIQPDFETDFCQLGLYRIMSNSLPPNLFEAEGVSRFHELLPIITWTPLRDPPFDISFFLCCLYRPNAYRFFYEMVSHWLIPGRRLNALLQFAADFSLPELGVQKYIGGEVKVRIETFYELEILQQNLPIIERELRLGVESYYQACRILEIKGLSSDHKTALVQENIVSVIHHRPQDFDYDILSEMQHFLVMSKEKFKEERSYRHMSRIICTLYLFRRTLKLSLESFPERRYINVKLIRAKLNTNLPVLGIVIGLSFLRDHEILEERHILSGIQAIVPHAKVIPGSFFCNACTFYIEIEKIPLEQERRLKEDLPAELKNRFELRLNPIFMPQNEEMVMRHIVTLSQQLKFVRDLPQVMIEFNQQTEDRIEFLVIVLRVIKPDLSSINKYFEKKPTILEYIPDRQKIVGYLRKKYQKEASVFRLRIPKKTYLRKNQSLDLYKARKEVSTELTRIIGEFRDYNGGIIAKESELFEQLKESLGSKANENAFLLENYFYSLTPPVMRSILPLEPIKKLFLLLLKEERVEVEAPYTIRMEEDENYLYTLVSSNDSYFHEKIPRKEAVTCFIPQTDRFIFGLIYRDPSSEEAIKLRLTIEEVMKKMN